ncbi:MAG: thioredoxin [Ignavibacteriales bacterium]|nr:MAG: thioredoxin [Ignavibacteriales bacterium]
MKTILLFVLLTLISVFPQEKYKTFTDEKSGKIMLVGEITREAFRDTSFAWWYNSEYENYSPDKVVLDSIAIKSADVKIVIVLGTWCSDSRREVPRFFKITDSLKIMADRIKLISVDRDKKDLSGKVDSLNIELVPTFIFCRNENEMGRITEAPIETLEKDFNAIVWKE